MASIAYVSDKDMLEYHRLNGNKTINFWRISTKRFKGFKTGDLLFFLSKRPEDLKNREKGIIGYGCLWETRSMSCSRMWKEYGDRNGFATKKELEDAIRRIAKDNRLPQKISCLVLHNVQFFQGPVYLSEFGVHVKSNLESFTYLDSNQNRLTLGILQKAGEIGLDSWSANQGRLTDDATFAFEILKYQIASVYEYMGMDKPFEDKKYAQSCFEAYSSPETLWISSTNRCFIKQDDVPQLYCLYVTTQHDMAANYLKLVGTIVYLRQSLALQNAGRVKINVISASALTKEQQGILKAEDVNYIYRKKD